MTAPRFDYEKWLTKTPNRKSGGFIINDPDTSINPDNTILPVYNAQLVKSADNLYILYTNGRENREVSSFLNGIIANLRAGIANIYEVVADNVTVNQKLISPLAQITNLETVDATISGTLYADNIESGTVDTLNNQLDLISGQYSTASAILADLQTKYQSYDSLSATVAGILDTLDLGTPTASIPADLVLNSLAAVDILAQNAQVAGTLFALALNSPDSDLYLQPDGSKPVHILGNLMALYPDGRVVLNGDLLLSGTLYAKGLDTQNATVSGTLAFYNPDGNLVSSVTASGSADFKQIATNELIIASGQEPVSATASSVTDSNATIGTATLPAHESSIAIASTKMDNYTLVYLTPVSDTKNQVLFVQSKQEGVGFTVAVPSPVNQDIQFNYWLVKTR
ncbi:MAG: hypothetical protein UX62_C0058G0003 [Microgenomates group bacterium GW2011_GWA2_46_7]|nr:MAG: hypothetical protein UX62_C0058G0003 [Microgenomates group bacterium GW2011_GWA2_46_7]